jgi:hypothetical protein
MTVDSYFLNTLNMTKKVTDRLKYLCDVIPQLLTEIDEQTFSLKPAPTKWSKKEIIGHLIDSAANNHHRFIRGQFEDSPTIFYDQNKWNELSFYQQAPKQHLIEFWALYNRQLIHIIKFIPTENLQRTCTMKDGTTLTLDFLITDYLVHLEHHLRQVVNY